MYVLAPHPQINGWWQLLRVERGEATTVGMFDNKGVAERVRDLLNRHGLVDADLEVVDLLGALGDDVVVGEPTVYEPPISWSLPS